MGQSVQGAEDSVPDSRLPRTQPRLPPAGEILRLQAGQHPTAGGRVPLPAVWVPQHRAVDETSCHSFNFRNIVVMSPTQQDLFKCPTSSPSSLTPFHPLFLQRAQVSGFARWPASCHPGTSWLDSPSECFIPRSTSVTAQSPRTHLSRECPNLNMIEGKIRLSVMLKSLLFISHAGISATSSWDTSLCLLTQVSPSSHR